MVQKPVKPMPLPWIFAVVLEMLVRFREYTRKDTTSAAMAMFWGFRLRETMNLRSISFFMGYSLPMALVVCLSKKCFRLKLTPTISFSL